MGIRGPHSSAPGGYGCLTPKGYRRVYDTGQQRYRMEHVIVWERHNGPVPEGLQVHHRNEVKLDNRIENLELLSPLAHKREHGGCFVGADGVEYKPCRKCGKPEPLADYYI